MVKALRDAWSSTRCRTGLTSERHGYCPACTPSAKAEEMRGYNGLRRQRHPVHCTHPWRKISTADRAAHPIFEACGQAFTEITDHRVPLEDGGAPFGSSNLQALCRSCHQTKTSAETSARGGGGSRSLGDRLARAARAPNAQKGRMGQIAPPGAACVVSAVSEATASQTARSLSAERGVKPPTGRESWKEAGR